MKWTKKGEIRWTATYRGHEGRITFGYIMYGVNIDGKHIGGAPTLNGAKAMFKSEADKLGDKTP